MLEIGKLFNRLLALCYIWINKMQFNELLIFFVYALQNDLGQPLELLGE